MSFGQVFFIKFVLYLPECASGDKTNVAPWVLYSFNFKNRIPWSAILYSELLYCIKGSMTHLEAFQISMKFLLQVASDIRRKLNILEL